MSSHHIVREDQEPALLIVDAYALSYAKINELLEWSPTVITCEPALSIVLSWGIKVDVAIIANHELFKESLAEQQPIKIIYIKHDSYLSVGLGLIQATRYKSVNILVDSKFELSKILQIEIATQIVVYSDNMRWSLIKNGTFEKWVVEGTQLFLYPTLAFETTGLSENVISISTGLITVKGKSQFWVGELII